MNYPKKRYTGEKPWMNYDWLYDQYITQDKRSEEIAEEYGCKQNTIQCWLRKHGIKKKITSHYHKKKHDYETYNYLYHNHIELHKSMADLARENNVSGDTIRENLLKNGITPWRRKPGSRYSDHEIDTMVDLYCNQMMSANTISKLFQTDHNTIIRQLRKRGVCTRGVIEAQYAANGTEMNESLNNADLLKRLHWDEGMSCKAIGEIYGVEAATVRRQMHRLGIKTKTNSESKIGLMAGDKHPNWKGGKTPLNLLLREYFNVNQAPAVAKRDGYTCQLCGAVHTILHVHHIRSFSNIVKEICAEHSELNPADANDTSVLYDIITHDPRFLDETNLITFCKECHLFKIHNYNRKTISSQASNEEGSETIL